MSDLKASGGEVRATVTIRRAATGKVETYDLLGCTTPEQHERIMQELNKDKDDGGHALDSK